MLYLVATPIGNLADITFRAIEILNSVDYILCEDTRHSSHLLQHYQIQKPLKSFHKFSESSRESEIIDDLLEGKSIALISDAGTPGISDPGTNLVKACVEKAIAVTPIPGTCAAITALSASGLDTDRFQFYGFLPKKSGELRSCLKELLAYAGTTICYESPNRLVNVLEEINELAPERLVVVVRELTKKFEEKVRGNASQHIDHWKNHILKGEIVLLIEKCPPTNNEEWLEMSPLEHVEMMQKEYSLTKNEAIKMVAEIRGVPKRTIYNEIVKS